MARTDKKVGYYLEVGPSPSRLPRRPRRWRPQQLRQMGGDGIVRRIVHHQVPLKVEYCLTDWGQALCPALDALLQWAAPQDPASIPAEVQA